MQARTAHYERAYAQLTFLYLQKKGGKGGRSSFEVGIRLLTLLRGSLDEFSIGRHSIIRAIALCVGARPPGLETVICRKEV